MEVSMRRRLAIIFAVSLMGAALLFASDSWNGFTLTAFVGGQGHGGGARLSYPTLSAGEYATLDVTVHFTDGSSKPASNSIYGPASSGTITAATGGDPKIVSYIDAEAYCVRGGQSATLYDTATN